MITVRENTLLTSQINESTYKGLEFLYKNQLPYGEFKTYISPDKSMDTQCEYISTTYITTFILYSISFIDDLRVKEINNKGIKFLLDEMEPGGIWRFFTVNRSLKYTAGSLVKYTENGIVPDLDDTACISFCLNVNQTGTVSNQQYFIDNRDENGLYYTWLMNIHPRCEYNNNTFYMVPSKNDICVGVNSNVLLYLGENSYTSGVCEYINRIISQNELDSNITYFPDKITVYYLISRAYFNGVKSLTRSRDLILNDLIKFQNTDGSFGNNLTTSLAACTLLNFDYFSDSLIQSISNILASQNPDGSWRKARFCDGGVKYYGSEELTTAICLEALARYRQVIIRNGGL